MRFPITLLLLFSMLFAERGHSSLPIDDPKSTPASEALENAIQLSCLTQPGSAPFHLRATSAPAYSHGANINAEIEEYWISPEKWRRTIHSKDFDQTVVVNGKLRFEQNSSDYYPKWLNDIVVALFEVAPAETVQEIAKLAPGPLWRTPPWGVWGANYSLTSTDGHVTASWGGGLNFDSTGTLTWISSAGYAAGLKDYEPFHGKSVARSVETFAGGDIKTRVTELTDLNDPDENMFAIKKPTPPKKQIRTVHIPEVEYRKLAVDPPEMKWPPVQVRPTSGTLATYIVTDRTGRIRDCKFIISNNMSLADGAVEQVRKWRFKPLLVDGVPVQVETTMTFAYNTEIVGDQAKYQAASFYFKQGRDQTYPRTEGSQPFHLKGTFQGDGNFAAYQGSYEETWFAPDRWRREITIGSQTIVETRIGEDHYRQTVDSRVLMVLQQKVLSLFGADFLSFAHRSPDTDWTMAEVEFQNVPVTRVAMSHTDDDGNIHYPRACYFDQNGLMRARTNTLRWPDGPPETITYNEFAEFAGKQIPHLIDSELDGVHTFTARINMLEPAQPAPDSFFVLPGIKPDAGGGQFPWW